MENRCDESPQPIGGGGRKRPPFERMERIFGLLQDGKYPNFSTMAAEFEVSPKTARRDQYDFQIGDRERLTVRAVSGRIFHFRGHLNEPVDFSTKANFLFKSMSPKVSFKDLWQATTLSSVLFPPRDLGLRCSMLASASANCSPQKKQRPDCR